jgi:hypothetical protein
MTNVSALLALIFTFSAPVIVLNAFKKHDAVTFWSLIYVKIYIYIFAIHIMHRFTYFLRPSPSDRESLTSKCLLAAKHAMAEENMRSDLSGTLGHYFWTGNTALIEFSKITE